MRKFAILISFLACCMANIKTAYTQNKDNMDYYSKEWKEVTKLLQQDNLPQSALLKINEIWNRATSEKNETQQIKSLIVWSDAKSRVSETTKDTLLPVWIDNIDRATGAHKAVLQSVLAEMIWNYLESNRWTIADRTATLSFEKNDIATWAEKDFENKAAELYLASVSNTDALKIPIEQYAAVLNQGKNSANLRPFLYDVLVSRAVEHFTNTRTQINKPVNPFRLSDDALFLPAEQFISYKFSDHDTLSPDYRIVSLLQDWLAFHEKDEKPDAFLDADMARLDFMFQNSSVKNKLGFYRERLNEDFEKYRKNPVAAGLLERLAQSYLTSGSEWDGVSETKKWDYKTAWEIANQCVQNYPSTRNAATCRSIMYNLTQHRLEVQSEEVNVANRPVLLFLKYNGAKRMYYNVIQKNEAIEKAIRAFEYNGNRDAIVKYLSEQKAVQQGQIDLPDPGDYREHSVEFMLNPLSFGDYLVLFSSDEKFVAGNDAASYFSGFSVSNLAISINNDSRLAEILITDRISGKPLQGVLVTLTEVRNVYSGNEWKESRTVLHKNVKTAKDGFARLAVNNKDKHYSSSLEVVATQGQDHTKVLTTKRYYDKPEQSRAYVNTKFYTDRAIYRPGQTIYFKGLLLSQKDGKSEVLSGRKVKVTFRNANSQKVEDREFTTNQYGSFDGSFIAPTSGLLGQMSLVSSEGGVQWVSVEEYKRPTFETIFEPVSGEYKLNDYVTMKVKAQAFAGNLITNANVVYRIVRKTAFPFWPVFRYVPFNISSQEIFQGTGNTGDNGIFSFRFPLIPDDADNPERKPRYTYEVVAEITDQAGETRTATTSISAGYVGVDVELSLDDEYRPGSKFDASFSTSNLNGQLVNSPSVVRIFKLSAPGFLLKSKYWGQPQFQTIPENTYRKAFPNFAYGNEDNPDTWKTESLVFEQSFDSSHTFDIDINKWKPGRYKIEIEVKDYKGSPVVTDRYFSILSDKNAENFTRQGLSIRSNKDSYQPGEKAVITLESPGDKYAVWVEVEKRKEIVSAYWLNVKSTETIELPVVEEDRGNFTVRFYYVFDNRKYEEFRVIRVPYSNKDLKIEYLSFRDKLMPGQNESWKIKISGAGKDRVAAELVAAMYDASLDMFRMHGWSDSFFSENYFGRSRYDYFGFAALQNSAWQEFKDQLYSDFGYPFLDFFGFYPSLADINSYYRHRPMMMRESIQMSGERYDVAKSVRSKSNMNDALEGAPAGAANAEAAPAPTPTVAEPPKAEPELSIRENLKETVFFMPSVNTDQDGNYILDFKMNEALTRWKLLLFAHTRDMEYAFGSRTVVTQKDLMIQPNMPRFLRQGDEITLSARISNISDKSISGKSRIQLFDALNGQDVTKMFCDKAENEFSVHSKQNVATEWKAVVPADWTGVLEYKVFAISQDISDGEASVLPVLTDKMLVTETLPLPVRGGQSRSFTLKSLSENTSATLKNVSYTLEFTANPAWYAVKALPYLSEYLHECSEQIFSRIYANVLASYVANKNPKIKEYYDKWKNDGGLVSNLSKNQELKNLILNETPWVRNAMSEEEQMRNISLLFDLNRIQEATNADIGKLLKRQGQDGGFGWFPGFRSDWYITQYIIGGFEHLNRLKVLPSNDNYNTLITNGKSFIDQEFLKEYARLKKLVAEGKAKWEDNHLTGIIIHYLYTRSFDKEMKRQGEIKMAFDYYLGQCEKYWNSNGLYHKGLIALVLNRFNMPTAARKVVSSLSENAIRNEELGMYWKEHWGYYWYQMPVETQSLMIEVFSEVAGDQKSVDELRIWLLKNKQTNHWKSTKATSEAIYALLLSGSDWISETKMPEIKVGGRKLDISSLKVEPGTGYFKKEYPKAEISPAMGKVEVYNPNKTIAWGGIYWQYFESMDKIKTFAETPLTIVKNYFIVKNTDAGELMVPVSAANEVKLGDRVRVRVEIRVDRLMEYVHLKDMRGSGFEPVSVLSQYKFKGGLGYYESPGDLATNFFISHLPKGTYVFEYDLRANNKGDFSMGISTMQCMYAPEFSAHSAGERIKIK